MVKRPYIITAMKTRQAASIAILMEGLLKKCFYQIENDPQSYKKNR